MYRKHVGRALILALMLSGATSMNAQRITRQFKNVPLKTGISGSRERTTVFHHLQERRGK